MGRALLRLCTIATAPRCESDSLQWFSDLLAFTVSHFYCAWRRRDDPTTRTRFRPYSECYKETTPLRTPPLHRRVRWKHRSSKPHYGRQAAASVHADLWDPHAVSLVSAAIASIVFRLYSVSHKGQIPPVLFYKIYQPMILYAEHYSVQCSHT